MEEVHGDGALEPPVGVGPVSPIDHPSFVAPRRTSETVSGLTQDPAAKTQAALPPPVTDAVTDARDPLPGSYRMDTQTDRSEEEGDHERAAAPPWLPGDDDPTDPLPSMTGRTT